MPKTVTPANLKAIDDVIAGLQKQVEALQKVRDALTGGGVTTQSGGGPGPEDPGGGP